jgi:hypothetical protein
MTRRAKRRHEGQARERLSFAIIELVMKEKKKDADCVNTTDMDKKGCCFVFCTTQWM